MVSAVLASTLALSSCVHNSLFSDLPSDEVSNTDFKASEEFSFAVEILDQSKIQLSGITGFITITGSPDLTEIRVTGEKIVGSSNQLEAQQLLRFLSVETLKSGDNVVIRTVQPELIHGSYTVHYTVEMPAALELAVTNITGHITVGGIHNDVLVDNVTGDVKVHDIAGNTRVNLVTGHIEGRVTLPAHGTIMLRTVTGNITLNIPIDTSSQLSANVVTGDISIPTSRFMKLRAPRVI